MLKPQRKFSQRLYLDHLYGIFRSDYKNLGRLPVASGPPSPFGHWDPLSGGEKGSKNEVRERQYHVEVVKMSLVMHVMMGIQPTKPHGPLKPTIPRHMHAEMEILVEDVIKAERSHSAKENIHLEKMLDPENHGRVQTENQGRIPPSEPYLFEIFVLQKKIGWTRTEDTVVDQGMGAKRIRPEGLVHQKPVQNPFKEAGVEKTSDKACCLC
jgi:hypothetical protein